MKSFILQRLKESMETKKKAAGVLIKANDTGRILLLLRNDKKPVWSLMSGGMSSDEKPIECLNREIQEELSINPDDIEFTEIGTEYVKRDDLTFHYFEGLTKTEFIPKLDHENLKYDWVSKDNLPSPLFDGMIEKIDNICSTPN